MDELKAALEKLGFLIEEEGPEAATLYTPVEKRWVIRGGECDLEFRLHKSAGASIYVRGEGYETFWGK